MLLVSKRHVWLEVGGQGWKVGAELRERGIGGGKAEGRSDSCMTFVDRCRNFAFVLRDVGDIGGF